MSWTKLSIATLAAACLCAVPVPAFERWSVIDGDTILYARVDGRAMMTETIGLLEVDAPDLHGKCEAERAKAAAARDLTAHRLLAAKVIKIDRVGRLDRFGRTLARVLLDGVPLSSILLQAGLARPYIGERRQGWC